MKIKGLKEKEKEELPDENVEYVKIIKIKKKVIRSEKESL